MSASSRAKAPLTRAFPYLSNVNADLRLIGFPAVLNPWADKTSSSRANMFSSHIGQAMLIEGCEFPHIFSGVERNFGEYEFNDSRRTQDARILAVIPKYAPVRGAGSSLLMNNPQLLVIYQGLDDKMLHYFTVDKYFKGSDGFGHENTWLKVNQLYAGLTILPKETKLVTSPAHKGEQYCRGTNLRVAYMTMMDTIDDAMLIRESAAAKFTTTEISSVIVNIRQDSRPVNLYGRDEYETKFMPDPGEQVGDHGILCAFRPMVSESYAADLAPQAMRHVLLDIDDVTMVKPGATIADVDFFINPHRRGSLSAFASQIDKYQQGARAYWERILEVYYEYRQQYTPSEEINTLVTRAATHLLMLNPNRKFPDLRIRSNKFDVEGVIRNQPVDFIQAVITYKVTRPLNKAFKLTDRHGGKGVVCRICPDDEMPVDAHGIRADLVVAPSSPVSRMNFGQLYEHMINRISEFVQRRCAELYQTDPQAAAEVLFDWYNDVNPNYAVLARQIYTSPEQRAQHVKEAIDTFIHLHVPPFLDTQTPENIKQWTDKWGAHGTPVTYSLHDRHGVKHTYTTHYPVAIGSKYMYCLAKLPYPTSAGIAHVSHYGIPIKPGPSAKHRWPTRMVPIRLGEDEFRVMAMDIDMEEVARLKNLYSDTPRGVNTLADALLSAEHPTAMRRLPISNEDLAQNSAITAMFHHTTATLGLETKHTLTDMQPPVGLFNDGEILGENDSTLGSGFSDGDEGSSAEEARWLASVTQGADDIAEALLADAVLADEESGTIETLEEDGTADLLDPDSADTNEGLASEAEEPHREDDTDPLHDPNVD